MGSCNSAVAVSTPRQASLIKSEDKTASVSPVDSKICCDVTVKEGFSRVSDARRITDAKSSVCLPQPRGEVSSLTPRNCFIYHKDDIQYKVPKLGSIQSSTLMEKRRCLLEINKLKHADY